ncbi:putative xylitol dehydrogenase [Jaminaea rosea]|uniref:Putative xylitol dehydrogenase n=1 Tax=Jaminaea rosea TaxID=1569628 RepID=A0A316UT71_9BASI|nr:putative xylitol dehydrogenase [Jaminaea rosea]PWN28480.1 putative xylitol dehydrogenase [Jaminaea rosea]
MSSIAANQLPGDPHPKATPIGRDNSLPVPKADGNLSFVLRGQEDAIFEQRERKPLKDDEVEVNIRQTGICGSDVHYLQHLRIGDFVVRKPMVLGHESAGIVTRVGKAVDTHKVGDRVALEPGVPCFMCDRCKAGTYNHCEKLVFAATPPYDGTLATYYNLNASFAHKIPDNMTLEEASLMEPLGVAVYSTVFQGKAAPLQNVLVFGAGPIGLLCAAVARAFGAKRVVVIDVVDSKLQFARSFCADSVYKPSLPKEGETPIAASERNANELLGSDASSEDIRSKGGFDLVLECTGAEPCVQMGLFAARKRSRFVQIGMGRTPLSLPIHRININEIEMVGSFRYGSGTYRTAIDLVAEGKIDVSRIVTHRYRFDEAHAAFEATKRGKGEDGEQCIKVQICQGEASDA